MFAARYEWGSRAQSRAMVRLLVALGATLPAGKALVPPVTPGVRAYVDGAQNWTALHRAADARDLVPLRECLRSGARADAAVESSHPHMHTALSIAGSASYPTAQPVDEDCLELLRSPPTLVKGVAPSGGSGGGSGGGCGGGSGTHMI